MKKSLTLILMLAFVALGLNTVIVPVQATNIAAGSVVKGEGLSTLYYIAEDGKRYVFPNDKTYFSWYNDFEDVIKVSLEDLYEYPLGGNVRYKPGNTLVKITTDPKVYAVGENGKLHWIKSENMAKNLYGNNWNLLVDDVPDSFFTNYSVDTEIESDDDYDPTEEEDEIPTPSYNLGFKARLKAQIKENAKERRCNRLETFISRIQSRLERFGLSINTVGSDYFNECFADDDDSDDDTSTNGKSNKARNRFKWHKAGKIDICHLTDDGSHTTINVNLNAAPAHLAHGDTLGACEDSSNDDDSDNSDDDTPEELAINDLEVSAISTSSATVTWSTNLDSDSLIIYNVVGEETTSTEESTTNTQSHSIELKELEPSTNYELTVRSSADDETVEDTITFTTDEEVAAEENEDTPIISELSVNYSTSTATITWTTDKTASGKVYFDTNEDIDASTANTADQEESDLGLAHTVKLTSLTASTTYFFFVESEDESNNIATSSTESFITTEE